MPVPAALQGSAEPGFPCAWSVGRGWIPALPSSRWISGRLGHCSLWIGARGVMSIPRPGMEGLLRAWVSVPSSLPGTREFPMELSPPGCSLSPWAMAEGCCLHSHSDHGADPGDDEPAQLGGSELLGSTFLAQVTGSLFSSKY